MSAWRQRGFMLFMPAHHQNGKTMLRRLYCLTMLPALLRDLRVFRVDWKPELTYATIIFAKIYCHMRGVPEHEQPSATGYQSMSQ